MLHRLPGRPTLTAREQAQYEALQSQKKKFSFPYYSKIRFNFARTGAGPYTYTLAAASTSRGFGYAIGDNPITQAGFLSAFGAATASETNLQSKNETVSGEEVRIRGIHAILGSTSDARAAAQVWDNVNVELSLTGGQNVFKLGLLHQLPGGAGLTGQGLDQTGIQPFPGGRPQYGFVNNGWPIRSNCQSLPEGLVWRRKGQEDSNLNINCTSPRALALTAPADEAAAGTTTRGYAAPADGALFVDVILELKGMVVGARSRVA